MCFVGECPAIQVIYKCTRPLVAALVFAVNRTGTLMPVCSNRLYRFDKSLRSPGMRFFIDIFQCPGFPEQVIINCHAVGRHADRKFIISTAAVLAGFSDIIINFPGLLRIPQAG